MAWAIITITQNCSYQNKNSNLTQGKYIVLLVIRLILNKLVLALIIQTASMFNTTQTHEHTWYDSGDASSCGFCWCLLTDWNWRFRDR